MASKSINDTETPISRLRDWGKASGLDIKRRQQASRAWFRTKAAQLRVNRMTLFRERDRYVTQFTEDDIGRMFLYSYDPKHKETLRYYDTLPVIFLVDITKDGFYGINMHYIPLYLRFQLMDKLHKIKTDRRYNKETKLKLSYGVLKSTSQLSFFKPCFKRYLTNHIKSPIIRIKAEKWDSVIALPIARFEKATEAQVHRDSSRAVL